MRIETNLLIWAPGRVYHVEFDCPRKERRGALERCYSVCRFLNGGQDAFSRRWTELGKSQYRNTPFAIMNSYHTYVYTCSFPVLLLKFWFLWLCGKCFLGVLVARYTGRTFPFFLDVILDQHSTIIYFMSTFLTVLQKYHARNKVMSILGP